MARHAWRELSRHLKENSLLTVLDQPAFELLITAYADWREAQDKAKIGLYRTPSGVMRPHPMIRVEKIYRGQLLTML